MGTIKQQIEAVEEPQHIIYAAIFNGFSENINDLTATRGLRILRRFHRLNLFFLSKTDVIFIN